MTTNPISKCSRVHREPIVKSNPISAVVVTVVCRTNLGEFGTEPLRGEREPADHTQPAGVRYRRDLGPKAGLKTRRFGAALYISLF